MSDKKKLLGCGAGTLFSIILTILSMMFSPMIAGFLCNDFKEITIHGKINSSRDDIDFTSLQVLVSGQSDTPVDEDGTFSFVFETSFPRGFFVMGCTSCEKRSELHFLVIENGNQITEHEYVLPIDNKAFDHKEQFDITIDFPKKQ